MNIDEIRDAARKLKVEKESEIRQHDLVKRKLVEDLKELTRIAGESKKVKVKRKEKKEVESNG